MMNIQLNGAVLELSEPCTLADLIRREIPSDRRIAVEKNGEIIPRSQYAQTCLNDGDQIEIVVAVGGG